MTEENIANAVKQLLGDSPDRKFRESVDMAVNLKNLDMSQPKFRVDETVVLPKGLGKSRRIAVFAMGDVGLKAKDAGADYVLTDEDIEELGADKSKARTLANECDSFIAEVQYMALIGKSLGAILGPRGKMPIPLTPDKNVVDMINTTKNSIRLRSKDKLTFHVAVGSREMSEDDLVENIETVINRLERSLDKGKQNFKSVYITTTMGKSVRVI